MDRYLLFQQLLTLVADEFTVTDAKMKNYSDRIEIAAKCDSGDIKIEVTIHENEDNDDAT